MEVQPRRYRKIIHDQENVTARTKDVFAVPTKRTDFVSRGALGERNTNTTQGAPDALQKSKDARHVKSTAACELEKKTVNRVVRSYRHVQSKVDTGITSKNVQPTSRPPLRREESTSTLAARAIVTKVAQKEVQNKTNILKESTLKNLCKLSLEQNDYAKKDKHKNIKDFEIALPQLPDDIEDIDANDNITLHMTVYIKDIYKHLTELEKKYSIKEKHLAKQAVITGKMRATLVDWLVDVQKHFSLELVTFHLTVGILDRYLQIASNVQKSKLQLIGITAMFIASKYEEVYPPSIRDFIYITENTYSTSDVIKCEIEILTKLGFCLARPVPLSFLRRFIKASHGTSKNHHLAKYFVDLSLVEYSMAHYRPSELAAAAVCLSLHLLSSNELMEVWTPTLVYYSGYTLEQIEPIIRKIAKIVTNVPNSKLKGVYTKYLEPSSAKVSSLPELQDEAIHDLAKSSLH